MPFNHKDLHIKNEEGSGLILSLMTLMVLSVLGASLGAITIGSYKLGDINRDDTSAYYIAEAGANMAYEEMKNNVKDLYDTYENQGQFFDNINIEKRVYKKEFSPQFGDQPAATIAFSEPTGSNPKTYNIISTGEVAGKKRTVRKPIEITWIEGNPGQELPILPKNGSLLGFSNIELGSEELVGKVYTNSTKNNSITLGWGNWENTTIIHPEGVDIKKLIKTPDHFGDKMPKLESGKHNFNTEVYTSIIDKFPTFDIKNKLEDKTIFDKEGYNPHKVLNNGNLYMNHDLADGYELNLNSDVYIPKVEFSQNNKMKINTNNKDITIVIDDLYLDSENIEIVGNGSVSFYITKSINFSSFSSINENGNANQFKLYYAGNSQLKFDGLGLLNGHVFVKNANVKAKNTIFNGYFVTGGNQLSFDSGRPFSNMYIIAPNSNVNLNSGYGIKGTVIADRFKMSGGSRLIYSPLEEYTFPFGSSGSTSEPSLDDLISSEPAIESK